MQPEPDAMLFAGGADRRGARVVDRAERVGAGIELQVDEPDLVGRGPGDGLFERQFTADIDADPLAQTHRAAAGRAHP
jgi:hypothetical protein